MKLIFSILFIACIPALVQAQSRAVWWWHGSTRWSASEITGNQHKEDAFISELNRWGFDVVYGSYSRLPENEPDRIAAWNIKLVRAGISSHLLLSDNDWIYPEHRTNLLNLVQTKLIDFNSAQTNTAARFKGLQLDIEPHTSAAWKNGDETTKQELLGLLLATFVEVRQLLDEAGEYATPVSAALPVWWDSSASVWEDEEGVFNTLARDDWFNRLGSNVAEICLMAYERDSLAHISSGVQWEVDSYSGAVRIALNADIGPGKEWESFSAFTNIINEVETAFNGQTAGMAINSFRHIEESIPVSTPHLHISKTIPGVLTTSTVNIGDTYTLESCQNLLSNDWSTIGQVTNWSTQIDWENSQTEPHCFFRVKAEQDQ